MEPQLLADDYPEEEIPHRIQVEWDNLSSENRGLWQQRYDDQMIEYDALKDDYLARQNAARPGRR